MPTARIPVLLAIASVLGFGLTALLVPPANASGDMNPGDLIRGESFSAVYYYGLDGYRYVFPNDKTYFTWYQNFDNVVWISDEALADVQIGGNVTYKPGVRMVKINSAPSTYVVAHGGILRHVDSEAIAEDLYGSDWNQHIDDIPDSFWSNYTVGEPLLAGDLYEPAMETESAGTIAEDKGLTEYTVMMITEDGFSQEYAGGSTITIREGDTVMFWNTDSMRHNATADDGTWGSGTLDEGERFLRRFSEAGTYTYHCTYHPEMTGTIIVEASD
jgi:plastocyanin